MYKCSISGKQSLPGELAYKVVTETRSKDYFQYDEKTSTGVETVKEIIVCREEYLKLTKVKEIL